MFIKCGMYASAIVFACSSVCAYSRSPWCTVFGVLIYICVVDKRNKCHAIIMCMALTLIMVKNKTRSMTQKCTHTYDTTWRFGFIWLVRMSRTTNQSTSQPAELIAIKTGEETEVSISRCLHDQSALIPNTETKNSSENNNNYIKRNKSNNNSNCIRLDAVWPVL